ncbi:MAG TPA: putative lipid II flippase FtsW [Acidimicrobiales bacterium]|nr:putative lipid II flippase FtsW [Acidimicrobiales bacterium]
MVALRDIPTSTVLTALTVVLCVFGAVMVGSASEVVSIETYGSPWQILLRECLWLVVGAVAFALSARLDHRHWRRISGVLLVATFVLLLAVLVPGVGTYVGGSTRWIGVGPLVVQPSEIMKLALVLAGADLIVRRERQDGAHRTVVGPLLLLTAAAAGLVLVQPDMGTAVVLGCIAVALLFASGVPMGPIIKLLAAVGGLAVVFGLADPYRRERLLSFIHPGANASSSGYQVLQSLIGLGSGHLLGVGLGNGAEKWGYLPNPHTDFIFSVIGEELGLVGAVCVLLLLVAFCWFGLRVAARATDRFGALLAVGLVAWIAAETVINVGAVVGLLPVTGIPLPFISYGGSSLVLTLLASGILVSIARRERAGAGSAADRDRRRTTLSRSGALPAGASAGRR